MKQAPVLSERDKTRMLQAVAKSSYAERNRVMLMLSLAFRRNTTQEADATALLGRCKAMCLARLRREAKIRLISGWFERISTP